MFQALSTAVPTPWPNAFQNSRNEIEIDRFQGLKA
jgi:hypothetical protein